MAFTIPFIVRCIPEGLSWPYPIGFDTITYIVRIENGLFFTFTPFTFLKEANLFYLIGSSGLALTNNVILLMKILGPILLGLLCFLIYIYSRKVLNWSSRKSLLVSILVATYFISLRNSSDLYRQSLGLIFLMATLISLKAINSLRWRYFAVSVFMLLTVMSHELVSVILFFIIGVEAIYLLIKKYTKNFMFLLISAVFPIILLFFQLYSAQKGGISVPLVSVASNASLDLSLYISGSLIYCYAFILPFVIIGLLSLKDMALRGWLLLCLGFVLLQMINPTFPVYFWYRWVLLLVYPLLFLSVQGLASLWEYSIKCKSKTKRKIYRTFVYTYLFSLIMLGSFYLVASPEQPFPYFSQYNPYLTAIPSSMLQNSISINDQPSLVKCVEWLNQNTTSNSAIITHYALYDLIRIYASNQHIIDVEQYSSMWSNKYNSTTIVDKMVNVAEGTLGDGYSNVYTIWWTKGEDWYEIPSLPPSFQPVYQEGKMVVYVYTPANL